MKYLLIIFISLFIYSCSTTTTYIPEKSSYTKEKAESIGNTERCFGINTRFHYWDLKFIDTVGMTRLEDSLKKLNPELKDPIKDICQNNNQIALTNKRVAEVNEIIAIKKAQLNEKFKKTIERNERNAQRQVYGSTSSGQSSNQANSNNIDGFKFLRGSPTRQYYNDMGKLVCVYADGYTITSSSTRCPFNP